MNSTPRGKKLGEGSLKVTDLRVGGENHSFILYLSVGVFYCGVIFFNKNSLNKLYSLERKTRKGKEHTERVSQLPPTEVIQRANRIKRLQSTDISLGSPNLILKLMPS